MRGKILAGFKVFSQFLLLFSMGLGSLAFAAFLPGTEFRQWNLFRASKNWLGVMGTITHSGPPLYDDETYDPNIWYEFDVQGKQCKGNNVQFGITSHSLPRSIANSWIEKYPVGSRVTVYYDPNSRNPCNDNVLERVYKPHWYILVWVFLSLVTASAGLLFLVRGIGIFTNFIRDRNLIS